MEARTGNGAKTVAVAKVPPRDRVLPLKYVEFTKPIPFEGHPYPVRRFRPGELLSPDSPAKCPKLFLDPELQAIVIEGRHYPLAAFPCWYERAKAA